jgi:hypothetical protein
MLHLGLQFSLQMSSTPSLGRCKLNKWCCTLHRYDLSCVIALKLAMERAILVFAIVHTIMHCPKCWDTRSLNEGARVPSYKH